jgi:hypothetical protein
MSAVAVIPREGVESYVLLNVHTLTTGTRVIPREGVEREESDPSCEKYLEICDPERGS